MASLTSAGPTGLLSPLVPFGVLALTLVALATVAIYFQIMKGGRPNESRQHAAPGQADTMLREACGVRASRSEAEVLEYISNAPTQPTQSSVNDDCVAMRDHGFDWGSDSEEFSQFTTSELLLRSGVSGDLAPASVTSGPLSCSESPLLQHRLARSSLLSSASLRPPDEPSTLRHLPPGGSQQPAPAQGDMGELTAAELTPGADCTSSPLPLAPVPPPYTSFIRYRTWFAELPGYQPSQLTPGWQERLRLLLTALNRCACACKRWYECTPQDRGLHGTS